MEYFVLYMLGSVPSIVVGLILISIIVLIIGLIDSAIESDNKEKPYALPKKYISVSMFVFAVAVFFPSEKSLQYMSAYYVGKTVMQSETSQKLMKIVNAKLDEEIKELSDKK